MKLFNPTKLKYQPGIAVKAFLVSNCLMAPFNSGVKSNLKKQATFSFNSLNNEASLLRILMRRFYQVQLHAFISLPKKKFLGSFPLA